MRKFLSVSTLQSAKHRLSQTVTNNWSRLMGATVRQIRLIKMDLSQFPDKVPNCRPLGLNERRWSLLSRCSRQGGRNWQVLLPVPLPLLWHSDNDLKAFALCSPLAALAAQDSGHKMKGKSTTPPVCCLIKKRKEKRASAVMNGYETRQFIF